MGVRDIPASDYRGKPLAAFDPIRDLPSVIGHWDASKLTDSVGASPRYLPDQTANGFHLTQTISAKRGVVASGPNGLKCLDLTSGGYYNRTTLGASDWLGSTAGYGLPLSVVAVVKLPTNTGPFSGYIAVSGGTSTGLLQFGQVGTTGNIYAYGGSSTLSAGQVLSDGAWHVLTGVLTAGGAGLFVDGYAVGSNASTLGATLIQSLTVGAVSNGSSNPLNGYVGEVILCAGAMTFSQVAKATTALGAKWGCTVNPNGVTAPLPEQTTQGNGQACRIWEPPGLAAGAPLILYCHNSGGTEQIAYGAGNWFYPIIVAAWNKGWRVAASNQHGNSWGNQNASDDLYDLYSTMNTRQAVSKVIVWGSSMGGVSAALSVPDARIPVVGVVLQDAVTNLADVYAPQTGYSNFSSQINTAYGVTAYNQIPAGRDPNTLAASAFSGVRWRLYQSTTDTVNVYPTNNGNLFASSKLTGAPESAIVTHLGGHLNADGCRPVDFLAFAARCGF